MNPRTSSTIARPNAFIPSPVLALISMYRHSIRLVRSAAVGLEVEFVARDDEHGLRSLAD
jgi:hypothetical protein